MSKSALTSVSVAMVSLFLVAACAEDNTDTKSVSVATENSESAVNDSVMDQPVDFSSPESVEKTMENIRQQAGEKEASGVSNAIGYMVVYDLSVNRNKEKLYKKLDGKTPNQIIAMAQR